MNDDQTTPPQERRGRFQWRLSTLFVVVAVVGVHFGIAQWEPGVAYLLGTFSFAIAGIVISRRVFSTSRLGACFVAIVAAVAGLEIFVVVHSSLDRAINGHRHALALEVAAGLCVGPQIGIFVALLYAAYCGLKNLAVDRLDRYYVEPGPTASNEPD